MTDPLAPADPFAGNDSLAGTFTPQPAPTGGQQWQSAITAQQQNEMRKPSAADQVGWAFQQLKNFIKGGVSEVMRGQGVKLPEWSNRIGDAAQSEGFNTALGMATPAGMAVARKYAPTLAGKIQPERVPSALERRLTFGLTEQKNSEEYRDVQEWIRATRAEREWRHGVQDKVLSMTSEELRQTPEWLEWLARRGGK